MIKDGLSVFKGKRVLLLQGPVGPFFQRLEKDLTQAGAKVFKVNFNGGDWFFYRCNAFNYTGSMAEWPIYFASLLQQLHLDTIMLFGDCRPIHRAAHEIASHHGIEIGVFEEGYIRPNYITLERFGVNGNSAIPRSPIFYLNAPSLPLQSTAELGNTFRHLVLWAILYYLAASVLKPFFPRYQHHRPLTWLEGFAWIKSFYRKVFYAIKEMGTTKKLTEKHSGKFFLVPLQVHNDSQIEVHSDFDTVKHFIGDVIKSFAANAPHNKILVIKHHPMDRGYCDYSAGIDRLIKYHKLQGRCLYIHDQHLPTLLDHACGVVVVNSTVGLSAIMHNAPVKVCGKALYDMPGLTYPKSLHKFWREAPHSAPNPRLFHNFYSYLVAHSQLNGSFYKRLPLVASSTGLAWALSAEGNSTMRLSAFARAKKIRAALKK